MNRPADNLEQRIDGLSAEWAPTKKKLFSGFGYMINGNLAFGTHKKDKLIVRAGEANSTKFIQKTGVKIFDLTGRPMKNWLVVEPQAIKTDAQLKEFLWAGRDFAASLPPKRNT